MKIYKGKRLHIAAALLTSLGLIKELLIPLVILFVSHGFSRGEGGDGRAFYWRLALGGVMVAGSFLWGFLHWMSFRYRVEEGLFKVDHGVMIKKRVGIPLSRIHTVDQSEGLLHRLLGLVKVQIQTAGGAKPEAVLPAVRRREADRLETLLRQAAAPNEKGGQEASGSLAQQDWAAAAPEPSAENAADIPVSHGPLPAEGGGMAVPPPAEALYKLPPGRLFLAGLTANNLGVGISLLFAFMSQADDLFPSLRIFKLLADFSGMRALLILGSAVVFAAWLLAVASSVLRFADFTVAKRGGELFITRGLLERRKVTLPVRRIQAVRITQELIWKPFGLAALHVVCAGYGTQKGESTLLFPLLRLYEIEALLTVLCPEFAVAAERLPLKRLPRRAAWGYLAPSALGWGTAALLVHRFTPWGAWTLPAAALALLLKWRSYRRGGWSCGGRLLLLRYGVLTETVVVTPRKRVQYLTVSQTPLQRRSGLSAIKVALAGASAGGSHFGLKGLPLPEAMGFWKMDLHEK